MVQKKKKAQCTQSFKQPWTSLLPVYNLLKYLVQYTEIHHHLNHVLFLNSEH